ncbi:hypothetical protein RQP46_003472 [Phenoliferia psychrophenolica]
MLRASLSVRAKTQVVRPARRFLATAPTPVPTPEPVAAAASAVSKGAKSASSGVRSAVLSAALLTGTAAFLYYAHDSRAGIHRWVLLPAVGLLTKDDPEAAHELAVKVIASGFAPVDRGEDDDSLRMELFGKSYSNPIGIAAGFDKHGEAIDGLFNLGFGYVEIGSVTPEPQGGNPKPRVFRVPETNSIVNRYGFNSEGHASVLARLRARVVAFVESSAASLPPSLFPTPPANAPISYNVVTSLLSSPAGSAASVPDTLGLPRSLHPDHILGVNLGKNKLSSPDSIDDFVAGVHSLGPYADVLVINVSSPNTPGLRDLQRRDLVETLLTGVLAARNSLPGSIRPPVLVKIAPDLDDSQLDDIAAAVLASGADGIIVSNTTLSRPASAGTSPNLKEMGGLSGPPVKPLAIRALERLYTQTEGKVPLVGCGGISSGQDAVDFARAGASLVQVYTAMVYDGFGLPRRLKDEVAEILRKDGNKSWKDVVGAASREKAAVAAEVAAEAARVQELARIEEAKKPKPQTVDFEAGLQEAQLELEALLVQLAEVEAPLPSSLDAPIAPVPALVAESIPSPSSPDAAPILESTSAPSPTPVVEIIEAAVPENILNADAVAALLDPAQAQVDAGLVVAPEPKVEQADVPKVKEGKRWV